MELHDADGGDLGGFGEVAERRVRQLPDDLPKSLDDRKHVSKELAPEMEMYDAWQGKYGPALATSGACV